MKLIFPQAKITGLVNVLDKGTDALQKRLHLGHALSALLNDRLARRMGGRLLLRIEDIDPARSRPDHEAAILADLAWLGLQWEEPVRRQSEHMADHGHAAARLRGDGLLYPCFCTRGDVLRDAEARAVGSGVARDPDGVPLYAGPCRGLGDAAIRERVAAGLRPCWRLDTGRAAASLGAPPRWTRFDLDGRETAVAARPERWGDPVVVRRDVPTSYHLAVVVDDALQAVSHVVRGQDLEDATDLHVLLQRVLALPTPRYHHHALMRDEAGAKLSKSRGAPALASLRDAGVTPAEIAATLGLPP